MSLLLYLSDDDGPAPPTDRALAYASMLINLLPPGKVWRLVESQLRNLFIGSGDELARVHARVDDLLAESVPTTLDELLGRSTSRPRSRRCSAARLTVLERTHAFSVAIGDVTRDLQVLHLPQPDDPGTYFVDQRAGARRQDQAVAHGRRGHREHRAWCTTTRTRSTTDLLGA
jgi:hypothetical protein